jgi:hypothetical protein
VVGTKTWYHALEGKFGHRGSNQLEFVKNLKLVCSLAITRQLI